MTDQTFRFTHRDADAEHFFHRPQTTRPTGAATQWLCFRFRSDGMFTHSPASHWAIVLRARLGLDAAHRPESISGRGITLGDTSLAVAPADNAFAQVPGFGGARGVQVESFWPGGNFLHARAQALPEGLRDGVDYRVSLHVSDARWVAFAIAQDAAALPPPDVCVRDRVEHPVIADATGVLIALGRGAHETGPWSVCFSEIATGWFDDASTALVSTTDDL